MKLGADQFEQILGSLRSFTDTSHNDKRRSPRVGVRMRATLVACDSVRPVQQHTVGVRDLSAEGIGLTHSQPLAAGSYFIVVFRRSVGEVLSVLYRVAHCERLSDRSYAVGGILERIISAADVKGPVTPARPAAAPRPAAP